MSEPTQQPNLPEEAFDEEDDLAVQGSTTIPTATGKVPRGTPTIEVMNELQLCGKCKRPKVDGKCRRCGRPTDYTPDLIPEVIDYVVSCEDELVQMTKMVNEEKGYETYENKLRVNIPTIEGLALRLGISKNTIYDWKGKHPEFSDVLDELLEKQANMLINNGLAGSYNPTIAKVLLTKHGYREGIEQEHSGNLNIGQILDKLDDKK